MRSSAVVAALVAGAAASYAPSSPPYYGAYNTSTPVYEPSPVYTTEVVTAYTTYCPGATHVTHNGVTYTVTEATTLTITNCPCTITYPVSSSSYVPPPVYTSSEVKTSSYVPPPVYTSAPYSNGTTSAPYVPSGTGTSTYSSPPATYTGAANKAIAASGAGLAAVFGLVAYVL